MAKQKKEGITKEQKLVKLLTDGKLHAAKECVKVSGFSEASVKMYLSQSYLDRKGKPYKVVSGGKGKEGTYSYEGKKV